MKRAISLFVQFIAAAVIVLGLGRGILWAVGETMEHFTP
jgi:hypothetical protein